MSGYSDRQVGLWVYCLDGGQDWSVQGTIGPQSTPLSLTCIGTTLGNTASHSSIWPLKAIESKMSRNSLPEPPTPCQSKASIKCPSLPHRNYFYIVLLTVKLFAPLNRPFLSSPKTICAVVDSAWPLQLELSSTGADLSSDLLLHLLLLLIHRSLPQRSWPGLFSHY